MRTLMVAVALVLSLGLVFGPAPGAAMADDACAEPNDTAERACDLPADRVVEDELANSDDVDRFAVVVKEGQSVEVAASLRSKVGGIKVRLEGPDGQAVADVGTGPGERRVLAERLPGGRYVIFLTGDGGDPGSSYAYRLSWGVVGNGEAVPLGTARGNPRDLAFVPVDVGDQAVQTGGRLLVTEIGRVYESVFERENSEKVRKFGPMYLYSRIHVAASAERAQSVWDSWNVDDHLPEANDRRPYTSLGDQPMPGFGDLSRALGACYKCDDENPLRSYRIVARFDTAVYVIYSWGRDSSSNFDVVMFLASKLPKRLG